jgi:hypothetical protein
LERRLLLLPITWAAFGLGEVYGLRFLLGPVLNVVPTSANDKPIGGSIFPVLFFNVAAVLVVLGVSLYSVGIWKVELSGRKERADLAALVVLFVGGMLLWYAPVAIFFVVAAIIYLLATNIE